MVSVLAVWSAELRFPLMLFAHRHAKDQLLELRTLLTSAGDIIQVGAWCFPFVFSPKLTCFIFSQGQIFMGTKDKKLLGSKPKSEVSGCGKWKGLWAHVWAKGKAGRFSINWNDIALGKSPLQALGPVLSLLSVWSQTCSEGFLDSARWVFLCSLAGAGSSSYFISAGLYFGAKQAIHVLRSPGVNPESRVCPGWCPAACLDGNCSILLHLVKKGSGNAVPSLKLGLTFLGNTKCSVFQSFSIGTNESNHPTDFPSWFSPWHLKLKFGKG